MHSLSKYVPKTHCVAHATIQQSRTNQQTLIADHFLIFSQNTSRDISFKHFLVGIICLGCVFIHLNTHRNLVIQKWSSDI